MNDPRTITISYDSLAELATRKRANNPKLHDREAIQASVNRAGFITPPVVNDADGKLIEGHGRVDMLLALRESGAEPPLGIKVSPDGEWLVPALHGVHLEPADADAFLIAANRTVELGGWDDKRLAQMLVDLDAGEDGLTGAAFDTQDLDRIVSGLLSDIDRQAIHPDDVPEVDDAELTVQVGDQYALGPHSVVCGDCRSPDVFVAPLGGRTAAALVTDPPYGVQYEGKTEKRLRISGDDAAGLSDLLDGAFSAVDRVLAAGAALYVFHPAGPLSLVFGQAVIARGWTFRQSLIWNKGSATLGHSLYQYAHEPILFATKPTASGRGRAGWFGGRDQSSVLDFPRPRAAKDHPTPKPVGLLETLLKNSTERGDVVLDPFLGSGSLLIAAERLGRRCVGVEIEPRYAQVAIRRWERFTGQRAHLVREG